MTMLLRTVFAIGPLIFGLAFLAPLFAQSMEALAISAPAGVSWLSVGLLLGGTLGGLATLRGRWL